MNEFTNNEREISIPYEASPSAVLKISSSLLVNEYRLTSNECINIFSIIQIEHTPKKDRQTLSQPNPWGNDCGVLNLRVLMLIGS